MSSGTSNASVSSLDTALLHISRDQEYETQYLGFAPRSFCDGLYNAILDYTWEYFRASQEYMKQEYGDILTEEELKNASEVFLTTVTQKIDENFDKLEAYVCANILHIPRYVVLPEDQVQEEYKHFTVERERSLDEEICRLKERIIAAKYVNASLKKEYKQLRHLRKEYNQFLMFLDKLNKTFKEARVLDMHESLVFAANQAQTLISLVNQMTETGSVPEKVISETSELETILKCMNDGVE